MIPKINNISTIVLVIVGSLLLIGIILAQTYFNFPKYHVLCKQYVDTSQAGQDMKGWIIDNEEAFNKAIIGRGIDPNVLDKSIRFVNYKRDLVCIVDNGNVVEVMGTKGGLSFVRIKKSTIHGCEIVAIRGDLNKLFKFVE